MSTLQDFLLLHFILQLRNRATASSNVAMEVAATRYLHHSRKCTNAVQVLAAMDF